MDESIFTWAVEQYVVILGVTQALLQPAEVVGKILHAENQASIRPKSKRLILHHIIYLNKVTDV